MFFGNSQGTGEDEIQSLWIVNPILCFLVWFQCVNIGEKVLKLRQAEVIERREGRFGVIVKPFSSASNDITVIEKE